MQPYSDDNMIFEEDLGQYKLTEKALLSRGIDIRARLSRTATVTPEGVIDNLLSRARDSVYNYVHQFNADNARQDALIACVKSLRRIIYEAMLYQAVYVYTVGDLTLSTDENERSKAIDENAKQWLDRTVCELGVPITYTGRLCE